MKPTYALSIKQPWAWLIVQGHKDVENRTWWPPQAVIGQRIYIHAGLKPALTSPWVGFSVPEWERLESLYWKSHPALGCIIGEATIEIAASYWASPWFEGPVGIVLRDPVAYQTPIPCKGRLRFFKPELPKEALL